MKYLALLRVFLVCSAGLVYADTVETSSGAPPYSLGGTYDSVSKYHAGLSSCLNKDAIDPTLDSGEGSVLFKQNQSRQSHHSVTTVTVTEDVLWGLWSNTQTYTTSTRSDNYTMTVGFTSDYTTTARVGGDIAKNIEDKLVPEALDAYNKFKAMPTDDNYKKFRALCGDKIITSANAGVKLDFTLVFKFDSVTERDGAVDIAGIDSFPKAVKMIRSEVVGSVGAVLNTFSGTKTKYSLTAFAIQLGGDPNELGKVFAKFVRGGPAGKTISYQQVGNMFKLTCGKGVDCTTLINMVVAYSADMEDQIKDDDGDYDYKKLYYYSPSSTVSYNSKIFTSEYAKSILVDGYKKKMGAQYFQDEKANLYASRYLAYLQTMQPRIKDTGTSAALVELIKKLKDAANEYEGIMAIYKDPGLKLTDCYTNVVQNTCQTIYNDLMKRRQRAISDQSIKLVNYLMSSQYIGGFYLGSRELEYDTCNIMPVGTFNEITAKGRESLFVVDCPDFENYPPLFTMKIRRMGDQLMVSPFSYAVGSYNFSYSNYIANSLSDGTTSLDIDDALDIFTDSLYGGTMDVAISGNNKIPQKLVNTVKFEKDEFNLARRTEE
jgi:hypothetical protein